MMKLALATIAFTALSFVTVDADARRFGGGKNLGMQRSAPAQQKAAPAQQQQQQQQAAPAQQPQPTGASKWLGPLAGLALGAGLAALFLNNGMAGLLAGLLVIGLIIAILALAARALLRNRPAGQPMQYAGMPGSAQPPLETLPGGAGVQSVAATAGRWPAGFNATEFVRHARLNFVKLQEAHDKGDLSALREFLAPDVYREIEADIRATGGAAQHTEVVTLEAEVLDVAEESGSYVVSMRFSGLIRESADGTPEAFSETWHLTKPLTGRAGWVVAGIQQA
jgi:predicted lipid-binding transport protein (Tim44 family)